MLILVTCLFLFVTAFALVLLRVFQPTIRYAWMLASGSAFLAFISTILWLGRLPMVFVLPVWQPVTLFPMPIMFQADGVTYPLALSIAALTLATLLTAATRPVFTNSPSWTGILMLGGLGILAVTANNPLTLLLIWALLDLAELFSQLIVVQGKQNNESVVISFAMRAMGIGLLFWANVTGSVNGVIFDFQSMPANATVYLILASGLRLGVFPLNLPYSPDSNLRRGFGTALRLIGAASSLSILGRITEPISNFTFILTLFAVIAALYGGWMWLRAPEELGGRPYWMIGMASLAVVSALGGNSMGAVAWATVLVLAGGMLFLFSVPHPIINRILPIGVWGLSALPLSLTASAWLGNLTIFTPFMLAAQALLAAGFIRHALRTPSGSSLESQPGWAQILYPAGITTLLIVLLLLGLIGWDGAFRFGGLFSALIASGLAVGLVWASRRFRIFNPARAHWVNSAGTGVNNLYQGLWSLYRGLARTAQAVSQALEGEGGIMWTLLFLILFVIIVAQGIQ